MTFINLKKIRPLRALAALILCLTMFLSFTMPTFAAPNAMPGMRSERSNPQKGEVQLDEIFEKSEEALRNPPLSMEKVQEQAKQGVNEVQGGADLDKMNRPSNSQEATSVEESVKNALEKVTPNLRD